MKNKLTELNKQSIPDDIKRLDESLLRMKRITARFVRTAELLNAGVDPDDIVAEIENENN